MHVLPVLHPVVWPTMHSADAVDGGEGAGVGVSMQTPPHGSPARQVMVGVHVEPVMQPMVWPTVHSILVGGVIAGGGEVAKAKGRRNR